MSILDAFPKAPPSDISVISQNKQDALDDLAKARIKYDDAFERFDSAMKGGEPEEVVSRLRREAENAHEYVDAAELDHQQACFVWNSFWN